MTVEEIIGYFKLDGEAVTLKPYGNGHINSTFRVETDKGHLYVLQKINRAVFHDAEGLMRNMILVTDWLRKKDSDPRHVLTLIPLKNGDMYLTDDQNDCWRVCEFIGDSICLEAPESPQDFALIASAFGHFQLQLADFPAERLTETIPHFHDTPDRFRQLKEAISNDKAGRVKDVQPEIDFYLSREKDAGFLTSLATEGKLPLRVTHNDTKINNIMLDKATRQPLCILDLDTVMPGIVANDFGDAIRFGASTAAEDEQDLSKVSMSLELFEAFAGGFLTACGSGLTDLEIDTLPMGARLMTLECGSRFLADHLNGDVYFGIHRPNHNLDRARTQMTLVADMEKKHGQMMEIIRRLK